ncbi:DUF3450 domain-containing protein [Desulfofustis glycolicus]|uniref:DUF3450 domain-containing protein n=1 Tax=Desulfofustis glycolicus DSM 9705 TaxID=1121409 RepID=A0A1M5X1L6_9BACT|nr:DUF3450 domain-containing protein [Desulfofustis glycolicus]MCB2215562.1 DUF3450 domain-containing protein [Desulfobulbaceae bacterium]SHH93747.1 Protein of unknown function [Desulfofustis glycolicus DSM 9705]
MPAVFSRPHWLLFLSILLHLIDPHGITQAAPSLETIEKPVVESVQIRQDTQQHEEQWRAEKQTLMLRYEELQQRREQLTARRQEMTASNDATGQRIAGKQQEIDDIEQIQTEIKPLIAELTADLQRFVVEDLPFLPDERRRRLDRLQELSGDLEISVSEHFRKAMEALLIEAEYGTTIEVSQQTIRLDDRDLLVNIFRLGRIALFFQSIDAHTCGYFNLAKTTWTELPQRYNKSIEAAMHIGFKRRPADLLTLPLGRIHL